jgi:predicted ATPase
VIAEKVEQHLQSLGIESETSTPYLLDLLGVKTGAKPLDALSAEAIKLRTFETLRGTWLRLSRQRPLVLVVEDPQWIDPTSAEYLATLVNAVAGARILLLMTYRPGSEMPGLAHSHVSQLAVSRLSPRASLALVRDIASEDQVPVALAEAIVEKAEGNPFFLEELTWGAVTEREHSASRKASPVGAEQRIPGRHPRARPSCPSQARTTRMAWPRERPATTSASRNGAWASPRDQVVE